MPTIAKLQNGDKIKTDEGPQELVGRFDVSRRDGTLIRLDTDGGPVWVNPHMLATISTEAPSVEEDGEMVTR